MKTLIQTGVVLCFLLSLITGCSTITNYAAINHAEIPKAVVSAEWVKHVMVTQNNGDKYVIAEVSWGEAAITYDKGHIPGAIHINSDEIEYDIFKRRSGLASQETLGRSTTAREDRVKGLSEDDTLPRNWWNLYPDKYLLPAFADMGIDTNTRVIVYGKDITAAARLAWALFYAGVEKVHLLDGGLNAWKAAGFDVSTKPADRAPMKSFGASQALHPEYLATVGHIREVVQGKHPRAIVADIRTKEEYDGRSAPYPYIPTKGKIKGALWGHAGDGPWTMESYVSPNGTLKSLKEIEAMWSREGITEEKEISFYCGTAWRSSLAFLLARAMGWENIKNFDSSWYEWSMGPESRLNPVE